MSTSAKIKISAYAALVILAVWFGLGFRSDYKAVVNSSNPTPQNTTVTPHPAPPPTATTNSTSNETAAATNAATTNEIAQPNSAPPSNPAAAAAGTNAVEQTNAPAAAAVVAPATNANASVAASTPAPAPNTIVRSGRTIGYLLAFVFTLIALGVLIAYDFTQIMGSKAVDFLFNDKGEGQREPEYEHAEQVWANGDYLEAIQLMRDYLKKNPREIYVALRIAEIYEKDLKNYLAGALEYEEVLKKKLPDERWGWAAIHLCNLYSKLNQPAKTMALLERIANEYPKTGAAKKARARLGVAEPQQEEEPAPAEEEEENAPEQSHGGQVLFELTDPDLQPPLEFDEEEEEPPPPPPPPEPKTNLPPGFRPKK
jgi:TolA-binding protein